MTIKPIATTTQKRANAAADTTIDSKEDNTGGNGSNTTDVQQMTTINATRPPSAHSGKVQRSEKRNEGGYEDHARSQRNNMRGNYSVSGAHSSRAVRQQTRERTEQSRAAAALRGKSGSPIEKMGGISTVKNTTENADKDEEETCAGYNSGDEHEPPKKGVVSAAEWKKRDEQFVKMLNEQRGFVVQQVEDDGACLFRSISLQIYGDEDMHDVIRQNVMDYIYKNREYFCHFVTEDINSYINRKRRKDSHGNHIEIQAMSEIYSRPVEVYCYDSTPINIFSSEQMTSGHIPLRLSYQRGSHYNAILDPYNATVGVGLGLADYEPKLQTKEAVLLSEQLEIERTMFEDKIKTTDWEATNEAIEEQIARESYLQWCRDNLHRSRQNAKITSTITSEQAECASPSKYVSAAVTSLQPEQSMNIEGAAVKDANQKAAIEETSEENDCENDDDEKNVIHSKKRRRDQISKSPSHVESVIPAKELSMQNLTFRKSPKYATEGNETAAAQSISSLEDVTEQPSTSKRSNAIESDKNINKNKAVSNLYAELLEATVTKDSFDLNETQMLQRAIQLSREDYLNDQKRIYLSQINKDTNSSTTADFTNEWLFEKKEDIH